jgi:hypothetical protein
MSLVRHIEQLSTSPRQQEEEYEYTSDFLEWFYHNLYRKTGFNEWPTLYSVSKEPEYEMMKQLCYFLINTQYAKHLSNDTRVKLHEDIKQWTIATINKYN